MDTSQSPDLTDVRVDNLEANDLDLRLVDSGAHVELHDVAANELAQRSTRQIFTAIDQFESMSVPPVGVASRLRRPQLTANQS